MITKRAESELRDYQQRVLDKLKGDIPGLIAYHSTGSGKTLTALKALQQAEEATGKPGLAIVPASLVNNMKKEIAKHNLPVNVDIRSYENAVNNIDNLLETPYGMVVFDEAHRLRNSNTARVHNLKKLIANADKTLMLTGTAGYNSPGDIASLVKLINPRAPFSGDPKDFVNRYIDPKTWQVRYKDELKKELAPYVDVYQRPMDSKDFPSVSEKIVRVPMSEKQESLYKYLMKKIPGPLQNKIKNNLPLSLQEAANLNAFATGIRQASDSPMHHDITARPEDSTKIRAAVHNMVEAAKEPNFRGVAYSNFLDAGLKPYAELLRRQGIEPLVFTGGMSAALKKQLVDDFNSKDKNPRVLLLSSSGGEGLDLKGVRRLQILEPHFNNAKLEQVKGRGARYLSHADLPEEDRNLLIEQFHSTMPNRWYHKVFGTQPGTAIDDYLYNAARKKERAINEIRELIG